MKLTYSLFSLFLLLSIGCGDTKDKVEFEGAENKKQEQKITAKRIENLRYTDYALSIEAEKALSKWEVYQELAVQISYLKKADLSFFNSDKKVIDDFVQELIIDIPEVLNTNPIQSRLVIVQTKILKLYDNLTLSNIDTEVQLESIRETLEAFANLNLQINKKMEFDLYNKIQPE